MKGTIILTEGRSGSNWLGGLAESTGVLGKSGEWLSPNTNKLDHSNLSAEDYISTILDMARTPNDIFLMKVFPSQLHWFNIRYGIDALKYIYSKHDVQLLTLIRNDRLRQAISFSKAQQTQGWTHEKAKNKKAVYDFDQICRFYFQIGRSYDFWRSYNSILGWKTKQICYEDLLPDGAEFIQLLANHGGLSGVRATKSNVTVQRNKETEAWCQQFQNDVVKIDFLENSTPSRPPFKRLSNIIRLLKSAPLKPYPYSY